ncbi:MAG: Gfo/Idh/MocA family oxidoreductase [Gemmatimonadetes bacterium]|nr:Gfo/Idh/MocA family oxidoreductase [Gemmatimonadota bacterium]
MSGDRSIGVGVIGFGFMGRTHASGYERARLAGAPCVLRGIMTSGRGSESAAPPDAATMSVIPAGVERYDTVDEMLTDATIHAVSICTWTDSHVDLALRALEAGRHVLVEKPVALEAGAIERLVPAARSADRLCMPAMCMRFWPGWPWLRDRIRAGTFGAPLSISLTRLAARPAWAPFYSDLDRSGGALFDLHVHDVDMLYWCFGPPLSVEPAGDRTHVRTRYRFTGSDVIAHAEGGWSDEPDFPFRMRYEVEFEDGIASFDLGRDPILLLTRRGRTEPIRLLPESAYDVQVRHFIDVIAAERRAALSTLEDSIAVTRILEHERDALARTGSE